MLKHCSEIIKEIIKRLKKQRENSGKFGKINDTNKVRNQTSPQRRREDGATDERGGDETGGVSMFHSGTYSEAA